MLWFVPALLCLAMLGGCEPRREAEALLLLHDIAAGQEPSLLKRLRNEPHRRALSFDVETRRYRGDFYTPAERVRGALLLIPGAAEQGKDDPRLVAFARSLARAGFAVLVPDFPSFRALQVHSGNIDEIADTFGWLAAHTDLAPAAGAGMVAFSYAAGPAILASLRPELRDRVDFIFAVGAYYDLREVLMFFTTGWFTHEGQWRYIRPNDYGKWIFVLSNLERIPAQDRPVVAEMARRMMYDLEADLYDLAERLTPEGRAIYAFVTNTDPQQAPELLRRLPEEILGEIGALDLAGADLRALRADLLLVHGRNDDIIPFSHSLSLAQALPAGQAEVFLVQGLLHVDLDPSPGDLWRLWRAASALLAQRP